MRKHSRIIAAAVMTGIMGVIPVFADTAELPVKLGRSDDGTKYEAVYSFDTSDIPDGKKLTLVPDATDKIGNADLSVSIGQDAIKKDDDVKITFTSTNFTESGDYSVTKNINGYLSDDYTAGEIPILKDFEYELSNNASAGIRTVTLTKYTGTNPEVVVYPQYHIDSIDSEIYDTVVGVTRYGVTDGGWGSDFTDGEYEGTDPNWINYTIGEGVFAGNTGITSVTFLDGVAIGDQKDYMIQSDNICAPDYEGGESSYHGYRYSADPDEESIHIQGHLDKADSSGNAVYKDIDGRDTVTVIEGPDMKGMFTGCTSLVEVKNIPDDVVKMTNTFRGCKALTTVTNLPSKLLDMEKTFMDCEALVEVPQIPEKVVNMLGTFRDCKSLNPTITLYVPQSVKNLMETFENCNVMEKTPVISSKTQVRNLHYTFYRCKKLTELPILPESVISAFRTFYGCESASRIVGGTPHVIGSNGLDTPIDLIDTYRGCKSLNADIYLDMNKNFRSNYCLDYGTGYNVRYKTSGNPSNLYEVKSYKELFSDDTWLYNCYDYDKLWQVKKDDAVAAMMAPYPGASVEQVSCDEDGSTGYYNGELRTQYRQQEPKGMFWESALNAGSGIRLYLPDNAGFAVNEFNFRNGSISVLGASGATGATSIEVKKFDSLPSLNGNEDDREREESKEGTSEYKTYAFNLSYHVEKNEERLDHIEISTPPDKTEYMDKESFDRTGMVVTAVYRLYTDDVATDTYISKEVEDYTTDKGVLNAGDDKVIVSYQGKSANQPVKVNLNTTVELEGIIKDGDEPLAGYRVELHSTPRTAVTDAQGHFYFDEIETGNHTLYIYDTDNNACGSVLIYAKFGESAAEAGNTDNMNFELSVSRNDTTDTIHVNGSLKAKEPESKPDEPDTKPSEPESKPDEPESKPDEPESEPGIDNGGEDETDDLEEAPSKDAAENETFAVDTADNVIMPDQTETQQVVLPENGEDTQASLKDDLTPDTGDNGAVNIIILLILSLAALGFVLAESKIQNNR